ncbi:MAG: S-methyl-5-thioribose-1-phosphate isomerase [Acidiferrobacterales bacterium]|nr:S-methyl-5-thioribose-1-phosphate isomerase [Acidiferrobacterales bacterium]
MKFDKIRAVEWRDDHLQLIDQRILPSRHENLCFDNVYEVAKAITDMVVRGAPAIGIAAAYGVVLAARNRFRQDGSDWQKTILKDLETLKAARPTAVNLAWAVDRLATIAAGMDPSTDPEPALLDAAKQIHADDIAANHTMGRLGAGLIAPGSAVLTHCNTGALATGGYGTALGVIRAGYASGAIKEVYADETRPWLQGARLTAWELVQEKIPVTLIADGAAAFLMKQGKVQWVIVGSDRIAANGDVANKIGTYSAAVAARHHGVKFMVVAPTSTIDMATATGTDIPIETREQEELLVCGDKRVAPEGAGAWNPVFDITPAELVDAIVTERGVVEHPTVEKMAGMMAK